ncbi:DNA polymerase-3 subunit delta' [Loktanella sp. DSM 29012]|uniref:DNA polymerase III subunit delta' n=1 Tax=Loktanella sp. DSM 29012 TaxID=1881056 RepID=UPI0008C56BF8|nr:DNA polymerase III subunit delta' [Loktanella sp. DSM 29012]SEQ56148.1 DNA polymerase-3 subunit delta' [Loktanella sp. DSM 29012]
MTDLPEPDRIAGAPHPRDTPVLFGQDAAIADFLDAYNTRRLHSGWLITGPRGVGKATLAWKIATFLLAQPASPDAGLFGDPPPVTSLAIAPDHPDARLIAAGAHPRLFVVRRPVDDKTGTLKADITVDTIRGMKGFFQMSSADGGRRVVIVDAADEMNRAAANAILKELEEPPARTTLLLIAHQPSRLLPTIRSRCRVLRCAPLAADDLAAVLDQAGLSADQSQALQALSGGSAGDAVRLLTQDGLALYAQLVQLLDGLPQIDRTAALKLAESCAGKQNANRFALMLDLFDLLLSRAAHAGIAGEPRTQGAPGEARLLTRISPHDRAARAWADLTQTAGARARHGRAVNLDPAALVLDMIFSIERVAQTDASP